MWNFHFQQDKAKKKTQKELGMSRMLQIFSETCTKGNKLGQGSTKYRLNSMANFKLIRTYNLISTVVNVIFRQTASGNCINVT